MEKQWMVICYNTRCNIKLAIFESEGRRRQNNLHRDAVTKRSNQLFKEDVHGNVGKSLSGAVGLDEPVPVQMECQRLCNLEDDAPRAIRYSQIRDSNTNCSPAMHTGRGCKECKAGKIHKTSTTYRA